MKGAGTGPLVFSAMSPRQSAPVPDRNLAMELMPFLSHPQSIAIEGRGGMEVARYALKAALPAILLVLVSAGVAGAAGHLVQTGLMFTPDKMKPDFSKLVREQLRDAIQDRLQDRLRDIFR